MSAAIKEKRQTNKPKEETNINHQSGNPGNTTIRNEEKRRQHTRRANHPMSSVCRCYVLEVWQFGRSDSVWETV